MNVFEKGLFNLLHKFKNSERLKRGALVVFLLVLLGIGAKFVYELIPRHYLLTMTGGSVLSQRHFLAKVLQEELAQKHVSLKIVHAAGSVEALEEVNDGKIDLALVQGGLDSNYPNVEHVATISPELIHFLVKSDIREVKDLRGKFINMGVKGDGVSVVTNQILKISGLNAETDYAETNFSDEEILSMRPEKLPDVIVEVSYAPSDIADFLVKHRDYRLLEMSFPPSLAMRLGWVADSKILAYMYSIIPAVPEKDIQVVGVNLHLVANKDVDPNAIVRVLETLYGPRVTTRFGHNISENDMLLPSGFQVSKGTELYLSQKQPFLTDAFLNKFKAIFGLAVTVVSILLVLVRWWKTERQSTDEEGKVSSHVDDIFSHLDRLNDD